MAIISAINSKHCDNQILSYSVWILELWPCLTSHTLTLTFGLCTTKFNMFVRYTCTHLKKLPYGCSWDIRHRTRTSRTSIPTPSTLTVANRDVTIVKPKQPLIFCHQLTTSSRLETETTLVKTDPGCTRRPSLRSAFVLRWYSDPGNHQTPSWDAVSPSTWCHHPHPTRALWSGLRSCGTRWSWKGGENKEKHCIRKWFK